MKEPIENEVGDLFNCVIVAVSKILHEQGMPVEQIEQQLLNGMYTKLGKYKAIVDQYPK
jgi:hypothetical protein